MINFNPNPVLDFIFNSLFYILSNNLLYNFFNASYMKIMPTKAAKLSSVKRVKYLTKLDKSKATMTKQNNVDQRPIQSRIVM